LAENREICFLPGKVEKKEMRFFPKILAPFGRRKDKMPGKTGCKTFLSKNAGFTFWNFQV